MRLNDDIILDIRRDYVLGKLRDGERVDGRAFDEYREIKIETGIIEKAEGSALVSIGNTQVIVGIKMQPGEPFPDTPDRGIIITNAELVPLASPTFEPGPPDESSVELARVVDRGIRESEAVDLSRLVIEEGEKVWLVFIDIHALDDDGNLMDASSLAAISALLTTTVPAERFEVGEDFPLPVRDLPVSVTTQIINNYAVVDPCKDEEYASKNFITITTDSNDNIVAMQKSGSYLMGEETLMEIIDTTIRKAKENRKLLKEV